MKTLKFTVLGRKAVLANRKYSGQLKAAFSFSSPAARFSPEYNQWLAQKRLGIPEEDRTGWNGKTSMVKYNSLGIGLLLGSDKELEKAGFVSKILEWKNKPHIALQKGFTQKDEKYSYQNKAIAAMIDSHKVGGGLILACTGAGKTALSAQYASSIKGRILFVVDQVNLLYQSQKEIEHWLKLKGYDQKVGVVGNSKFEPERVTVATIQTLQKGKTKKSKEFNAWYKSIDVVIIDEIHKQMSRRNFKVVEDIQPQIVFGLTATLQLGKKPIRMKCMNICGNKIFDFSIVEGAQRGILTQGISIQSFVARNTKEPKLVTRIKKDKRTKKVIKGKELANEYEHEVVYNNNLNSAIVDLAIAGLEKSKAVVILVERVRHLRKIAKRLSEYKPKLCYGKVNIKERTKSMERFDNKEVHLLIANIVFTKGVNVKRIDLIIDGAQRPNKDDCIQKLGRGVRLYRGKTGLLYFAFFTKGYGEKAAKSQFSAFTKHKIPVRVLPEGLTSRQILIEGEKDLKKALNK